jgi:hypothetical protein
MLLKKKLVINIKRINYVKSYELNDEWNITREEQKLLLIKFNLEKKELLITTLDKFNFKNISYLEEFNN